MKESRLTLQFIAEWVSLRIGLRSNVMNVGKFQMFERTYIEQISNKTTEVMLIFATCEF